MKKIAIIKLGALGDVIRTLPLAVALKKQFPQSEILWITRKESFEIIKTDVNIDKTVCLPFQTHEEFDLLYNFDVDEEATTLASKITAKEKKGLYAEEGYPAAFNLGTQYYLNTIFDDETKKNNKKTYQEMMFEAAELKYKKEKYTLSLSKEEIDFGRAFIQKNNLKEKKIVGIHIGASSRWPSKAWAEEKIKELIIKVKKEKKYEIILFGGPNEIEKHKKILEELKSKKIKITHNDPHNSLREFAALVNVCDVVLCSDSLALHIAIGLGKKTIGLFFCTPPNEVESYGLLTKIISPKLYEFFPERMNEYNEELRNSISVEKVLNELNVEKNKKKEPISKI